MADLSITATQVLPGATGNIGIYTAGAAITAGQVVYISSGSTVALADADLSSAAAAAIGIAVCGAATGQKVAVQTTGDVTLGAGAAPAVGTVYIASDTAGGIRPVADVDAEDWITILGVGKTGNILSLGINATGLQTPAA